ncbi:MAG: hypothetical protein AAF730_01960 [Bacteroidota bacterium]
MNAYVKTSLLCGVAVLLALALGEALVRLMGYGPWAYQTLDANEPVLHEPHPVRGWVNRPGRHHIPPYHPEDDSIRISILAGGQRSTRRTVTDDAAEEVLVVGGSYTQGWAISDDATYAWQLQAAHPQYHFHNLGVGGYGTYQSLLAMEEALPTLRRPALVLYGFMYHHPARNVAPGSWLRTLTTYSRRGHVAVPYATLGPSDSTLIRFQPTRYQLWPLAEQLAFVNLANRAYHRAMTYRRSQQQHAVTERLMAEMQATATAYGADFRVVLLAAPDDITTAYTAFLDEAGIPYIDCVEPLTDDLRVRGEGHPNGVLNRRWAACISEGLGWDSMPSNSASESSRGGAFGLAE